ncbi:MAG: SRPBCC domain-containing protein [Actinobacteria bacterium]|nr:SRPBCC domain-containing protein [Actinomycetota bacterium]
MRRTDKASRVVAAPPERVLAAVTDPEALTTWLPPTGMTARFDLRPGGSYRLVLTYEALADEVPAGRLVEQVLQAVDPPQVAPSQHFRPTEGVA